MSYGQQNFQTLITSALQCVIFRGTFQAERLLILYVVTLKMNNNVEKVHRLTLQI